MTFSPRDAKDVSSLVAKKLELYMNYERREQRFDPQGYYRTTPKMKTLDLMYQLLDKAELDSKHQQNPKGKQGQRKKSKSPSRKDKKEKKKHKKTDYKPEPHSDDGTDIRNGDHQNDSEASKDGDRKSRKTAIKPKLVDNSRRVVPRKEADRITKTVNKVFEEQDLDKLHVIHRYRPLSQDIAPITENGKVANYTLHVGSALHSKNYVDYYMKEGLQSGNKDYSTRLQKLKSKQEKEDDNEGMSTRSSKDGESNGHHQQVWTKNSRMREILSPLNSSAESVISSSDSHETPRNLPPITKGQPVYNTFLSSTPQSSRASTGKVSSHLNDARMFSQGFGYRVIQEDNDNEVLGAGSVISRQESRADIASSEEYCKFSTGKNASVSEIERNGDGKSDDREGIILETDPIKLRDVEMKYKKYQSSEFSSLLEQSSEESRAHANYHNSQGLDSELTARSARSHRSGRSQKSSRSHRSASSTHSHKSEKSCHSSQYTAQFEPFDSTISEDGSSTKRSFSTDTSLQSRSRGKNILLEPIRTVIESPEVPRLGLTSDLNDTIHSCTSSRMEDYMTEEEKLRIHPDTRAAEEKMNSSRIRAEEKDIECNDKRAEVSLNRYCGDEEYLNTEEILQSEPQISLVQCAEGETNNDDQSKKDQQNTGEGSEGNQDSGDQGAQERGSGGGEGDNDATQSAAASGGDKKQTASRRREESQKADSARPCKHSSEKMSASNPPSSRRESVKARSDQAQTPINPKRANEIEGNEIERGEDEVRNKEFDRGAIPVVEVTSEKKKMVERGDDTPRVVEQKTRLTVSAKRRGCSDYHTVEDNERGIENEYFQPAENEKEEYFTSDMSARDSELGSPPSTRPSSACSQSSQATAKSEDKQKKKKSLKRLSKASSLASVHPEIKEESRPQSSTSRDGRGDDSHSIKSGVSGQEREGENIISSGKIPDNGETSADNEGVLNTEKPSSNAENAQYKRPPSTSSRGSITAKEKLGTGHGYCISGEMLTRGIDDNSPRTIRQLQLDKESKEYIESKLDTVAKKESLEDAAEAKSPSRASQQSVRSYKSEKRVQSESNTNMVQDSRPTSSASKRSNGSLSNLVSKEMIEQERPPSVNSWKGGEGGQQNKSFNNKKSDGAKGHDRPLSDNCQKSGELNDSFSARPSPVNSWTGKEKDNQDKSCNNNKSEGVKGHDRPPSAESQRPGGQIKTTERQLFTTETVGKQEENVNIPPKRQSSRSSITSVKSIGDVNQQQALQGVGAGKNIHPGHISGCDPDEEVEQVDVQYKMDIMSPPGDREIQQQPVKSDASSKYQNIQKSFGVSDNERDKKEETEKSEARASPYFSCSETNQEIPQAEKAFVESESTEIIKEAMLGSTSLEDSETVIDFRPLSASTAKSIGNDADAGNKFIIHSSLCRGSNIRAPSRISEVTECEGSPTPGRNSQRSPCVNQDVKENKNVPHPAYKEVMKRTNSGQVLNLAELRSEPTGNFSQLEDDVFDHPAIGDFRSPDATALGQNDEMAIITEKQGAKENSVNISDSAPSEVSGKLETNNEMVEDRPLAVTSQPSEENKRGNNPETAPFVFSEKNAEAVGDQLVFLSGQIPSDNEKFVSGQKSAEKEKAIERPPSVSSQRSAEKERVTERPPSVSSQRSAEKEKVTERPPSVSSQRSTEKEKVTERTPSVSSQRSAEKEKVTERPPSVSSQRSAEKVTERPPSVSSQRSAEKVTERPPSVSSQRSAEKEQVTERPPSVSSQRSAEKEQITERPPSVSSQRSTEKEKVTERTPSVSSQRSAEKEKVTERPPSVSSQRSAEKVTERPPSVSSQRSAEKVTERPPSVSSQRSAEKVTERPPSVSSQRSAEKEKVTERSPSVSSQRSAEKEKCLEIPPSVSSQRSTEKEKVTERSPSVSSQRSAEKEKCLEIPPSVSSQRSTEKEKVTERPPSVSSQRSAEKEQITERPPSVSNQRSAEKEKVTERPPSVSSQRSTKKEKVTERPPSVSSQRSAEKEKVTERPPSISSQRSAEKEKVTERPPSISSQRSAEKEQVTEILPSVSSQRSTEKEKVTERSPSVSSQRSAEKEKCLEIPPSENNIKSEAKEKLSETPLFVSSQGFAEKETAVERPSSGTSQKSAEIETVVERPSTGTSQKSVEIETVVERPLSGTSQRSAEKETVVERPTGTNQNSAEKETVVVRPSSETSQRSAEKETVVERPSSETSQKSEEKVIERPASVSSQRSTGEEKTAERPPSISSKKPTEKDEFAGRLQSVTSQQSLDKVPSGSSQKSECTEEVVQIPPTMTSPTDEGVQKVRERPQSGSSQKSATKETNISETHHSICSQKPHGIDGYEEKYESVLTPSGIKPREDGATHVFDEGACATVISEQPINHEGESQVLKVSQDSEMNTEGHASTNNDIPEEIKDVDKIADIEQGTPHSASSQRVENRTETDVDDRLEPETSKTSAPINESTCAIGQEQPISAGTKETSAEKQNLPESKKDQEIENIPKAEPARETKPVPEKNMTPEIRPSSAGSLWSEGKNKLEDKLASVSSQRLDDGETHQKSINITPPPKTADEEIPQKQERPISATSQKSESKGLQEGKSSSASQKSQEIPRENIQGQQLGSQASLKSQAQINETDAASLKSEGKAAQNGRPSSAASQRSESKIIQEEIGASASSQSDGKVLQNERPSSAASQKAEGKATQNGRPDSAANQKS